MDNMPKLTAEHLAGLHYAYTLWAQIEEANDRAADEGTDEWYSFEEAIQSAISAARRSKQEP